VPHRWRDPGSRIARLLSGAHPGHQACGTHRLRCLAIEATIRLGTAPQRK
jgi:hypothetical protein